MNDPAILTAFEAADAIAAGRLAPVDLVRACLARIEALDGRVRAFVHVDGDRALARARALGTSRSRLHGLPVGVKDMIDTADMPTQHNSPIYQGHRPAKDAAVVAITRALGGIILGKTDTHEFAAGGRLPATTNPHCPERPAARPAVRPPRSPPERSPLPSARRRVARCFGPLPFAGSLA